MDPTVNHGNRTRGEEIWELWRRKKEGIFRKPRETPSGLQKSLSNKWIILKQWKQRAQVGDPEYLNFPYYEKQSFDWVNRPSTKLLFIINFAGIVRSSELCNYSCENGKQNGLQGNHWNHCLDIRVHVQFTLIFCRKKSSLVNLMWKHKVYKIHRLDTFLQYKRNVQIHELGLVLKWSLARSIESTPVLFTLQSSFVSWYSRPTACHMQQTKTIGVSCRRVQKSAPS